MTRFGTLRRSVATAVLLAAVGHTLPSVAGSCSDVLHTSAIAAAFNAVALSLPATLDPDNAVVKATKSALVQAAAGKSGKFIIDLTYASSVRWDGDEFKAQYKQVNVFTSPGVTYDVSYDYGELAEALGSDAISGAILMFPNIDDLMRSDNLIMLAKLACWQAR